LTSNHDDGTKTLGENADLKTVMYAKSGWHDSWNRSSAWETAIADKSRNRAGHFYEYPTNQDLL